MIIKNHDLDIKYTLNVLDSSGNKVIINTQPYYQVLAYTSDSRSTIAVTEYLDSSNIVTFDGSIIEPLTKGQLKFKIGMSDVDPSLKDGLYNTNKLICTNIYYNSDENVDSSVSAKWSSIQGNILEQEDLVELINSKDNVFALKAVVNSSFDDVYNKIDNLDTSISELDDNVKTEIQTLNDTVNTSLSTVQNSVNSSIDNLYTNVNSRLQTVQNSVNSSINDLKQTVDSQEKVLQTKVNSSLNEVQTKVNSSLNSLESRVDTSLNSLYNNVTNTMNSTKTQLNSSMNSLENKVNSSLNTYKTEVDSTITLVTTNKNNISDLSTNYNSYKVQVNSSLNNVYTKSEVDNKGYLTEETDPVWNSEKSNYITRTQLDASLADIKLDGYVKDSSLTDNYYNKKQIDASLGDIVSCDTSTQVIEDYGVFFFPSKEDTSRGICLGDNGELYIMYEEPSQPYGYALNTLTRRSYLSQNYYSKSDIDNKGYLTEVPSEYVTDSELDSSLADYAKTSDVNSSLAGYVPNTSSLTMVATLEDGTTKTFTIYGKEE